MSNITKYTPFTPEASRRVREAGGRKTSFISKLPVGRSQFRILPAKPGEVSPIIEMYQHWVDVPGKDARIPINCPKRLVNQPCPICQHIDQLEAKGDMSSLELASSLEVNASFFCNVIDRKDPDAGVKIWQLRQGIKDDLMDEYEAHGSLDFTDPVQGMDVAVTRKGTGRKDTRYKVVLLQPSRLAETDEQINQWIDDAKPLGKTYAKVLTPKQIAMALKTGELPRDKPKHKERPVAGPAHKVGVLVGQVPARVQAPEVASDDFSDDGDDDDDIPF